MYRQFIRKVIVHTQKKFHRLINKVVFKKFETFTGRDYYDYFNQVKDCYDTLNNPFWYYEKLIDDLLNIKDVEILPLKEFVNKNNKGKKQIGFRHDIDADPITAVKCARALAQRGLSGSFYFLHSAVYYGEFYGKTFVRNPKLVDWIKQIVIAGSEIGLHNDAVGLTKNYNVDGIKHLESEISWMRSIGTNVYGTVAHNNFLVTNAENYEIFKELQLYKRNLYERYRKNISKIRMTDLNLKYEGTFGVPKKNILKKEIKEYINSYKNSSYMSNKDWVYKYFFDNPVNDWECDTQIWLVGNNKWIIASKINGIVNFHYKVPLSKVMEFIKNDISLSSSILFVLHPEYFNLNEY